MDNYFSQVVRKALNFDTLEEWVSAADVPALNTFVTQNYPGGASDVVFNKSAVFSWLHELIEQSGGTAIACIPVTPKVSAIDDIMNLGEATLELVGALQKLGAYSLLNDVRQKLTGDDVSDIQQINKALRGADFGIFDRDSVMSLIGVNDALRNANAKLQTSAAGQAGATSQVTQSSGVITSSASSANLSGLPKQLQTVLANSGATIHQVGAGGSLTLGIGSSMQVNSAPTVIASTNASLSSTNLNPLNAKAWKFGACSHPVVPSYKVVSFLIPGTTWDVHAAFSDEQKSWLGKFFASADVMQIEYMENAFEMPSSAFKRLSEALQDNGMLLCDISAKELFGNQELY